MDERGPFEAVLDGLAWALVAVGVATWAVALTIFEPALSTLVGSEFARGVDSDEVDTLSAYLVRMPWMSILVGLAGALLLLRRSRVRGRLGWALLLGWL